MPTIIRNETRQELLRLCELVFTSLFTSGTRTCTKQVDQRERKRDIDRQKDRHVDRQMVTGTERHKLRDTETHA